MDISKFTKNHTLKLVAQIVGVPVIGFALLNLAFGMAGLIAAIVDVLHLQPHPENAQWTPWVALSITVIVIALITWFVLRSKKVAVWFKAAFSVVPEAAVTAIIGAYLYRWPIPMIILEVAAGLGLLDILILKKRNWMYVYALGLVAVTMSAIAIFGVEI